MRSYEMGTSRTATRLPCPSKKSVDVMAAARAEVKVPKGTRDFDPQQTRVRKRVFSIISEVFERHGAESIETPVFELKSTLTNKYGEDSKLIYDLEDQGGEILSLRYDLTVPFARYLATHNVSNIRRYQIGRVYRRDQPAMGRGRFREFYQCDFDIAGEYSPMVADVEVIATLCDQLRTLGDLSEFHRRALGEYTVKVNHRGLLNAVFSICGIPEDKIQTISSSIDKLDKESWETVRHEMIAVKGLTDEIADKVGSFTRISGFPYDVLGQLEQDTSLVSACGGSLGDLRRLFEYLEAMEEDLTQFSLDLSLARGLDYYTGVIFEVGLTSATQVGSIAAGGRYDTLVGMFSGRTVPCVGCSLGIERILTIVEEAERQLAKAQLDGVMRTTSTQVLVTSVGGEAEMMRRERMKICAKLRNSGIASEFALNDKPRMDKQLKYALSNGIPIIATIGADELASGTIKVKDLRRHEEIAVPVEELCAAVRQALE